MEKQTNNKHHHLCVLCNLIDFMALTTDIVIVMLLFAL